MSPNTPVALFRGKQIRKTLHRNEWCFVIVDVAAALTDPLQQSGYVKDMHQRDPELDNGWGQIATPFWSRPNASRESSSASAPDPI